MKNRYTAPFGYTIIKGVAEIQPDEAAVVHQIFSDYLTGNSLQRIAENLTAHNIEYLPGESTWNKNRVKRILEDARYIGATGMPTIIDEATYNRTNAAKGERNNQLVQQKSQRLACPVTCANCGAKMRRLHDARRKISESWICQCGAKVWLSDSDLQTTLTKILNRLIGRPDLVAEEPAEEQETPLNIIAIQNEISRRLEGFDFDRDKVKESIFELAALKYSRLDDRKNTTKQLRAELTKMAPLSAFAPEVLGRLAVQILLGEPAVVQIKLKNGQIVRKDENDECNGDPGQA